MRLTLCEIVPVLDGQCEQVGLQVGALFLDHLPARQIGPQGLGTTADGAERADEVLFAELRVVQPYLAHGEILPEVQVVATAGEARGGLCRFDRWSAPKVLQHRQ